MCRPEVEQVTVIRGIRWSNVVPECSGMGNGMLLDGMELRLPINVPANSLQPEIWSLKMSSDVENR